MPILQTGVSAPDFSLLDQDGKATSLSQFRGSYVLLYFYPKDDTPGCTKEACMIRDIYNDFEKQGIVVLGVSKDSPSSHVKFREKYELPFTLLSDPDKKVIKQYGASAGIFTRRISYLIDPKGMIARVYPKVDPASHAGEILKDIKDLK